MKGSIRPRGSNSWQIRVYHRDPLTGLRRDVHVTFHGTERQADDEKARIIADLSRGVYLLPSQETMAALLNTWLENNAGQWRPRTLASYRDQVERHIVPYFGQQRVQKVTPQAVRGLLKKLQEHGVPEPTRRYVLRLLSQAFKAAARDEPSLRNPCDPVERPKREAAKHFPPDLEKVRSFREAVLLDQTWGDAILLDIHTGMRRGEVLGLKWENVRPDPRAAEFLALTHQLNVIGGELQWELLKTEESARQIPLDPDVALMLRRRYFRYLEARMSLGPLFEDNGFVFWRPPGGPHHAEAPGGRPWHPDSFGHAVKRLLRDHGLPEETHLHTFRHWFATLLLDGGADLKTAQELLGHASERTLLQTYVHPMTETKRKAVGRFGTLVASPVAGRVTS